MNNYDRIGEIRKLVISIDILKNVLFPYFLNVVELANYGIRLYHEWKMNHLFNCFDVAAAILPHTKTPAHDLIKRSEKQCMDAKKTVMTISTWTFVFASAVRLYLDSIQLLCHCLNVWILLIQNVSIPFFLRHTSHVLEHVCRALLVAL